MELHWSVEELLPHSHPMILIDDLLDSGEEWMLSGLRIAEDSPFYDSAAKGVPAWVGIEYMAQTVALYSGLQARSAGKEVKLGLLLGTRRYQAETELFPLGSYLTVRAEREWDDGQMAVFHCQLESDKPLAAARINVYQPDDPAAFIRERQA